MGSGSSSPSLPPSIPPVPPPVRPPVPPPFPPPSPPPRPEPFPFSLANYSKYGDITKVPASGASLETAMLYNLRYSGIRASRTMAETDRERVERFSTMIHSVARKHEIHPALIAGIISRESWVRETLSSRWGDWDTGRGAYKVFIPMQVDQEIGKLVHFIGRIQNQFPLWSKEQQLKGGIAAYNTGVENVHSFENVDENTTRKDYSNDVVCRAQWYIENGFSGNNPLFWSL